MMNSNCWIAGRYAAHVYGRVLGGQSEYGNLGQKRLRLLLFQDVVGTVPGCRYGQIHDDEMRQNIEHALRSFGDGF